MSLWPHLPIQLTFSPDVENVGGEKLPRGSLCSKRKKKVC